MGLSFRRMAPLLITYVVLFGLSALGPLLSQYGGINRGHWVFLFLLPFAIGSMPLGFILGEVVQHRTRSVGRVSWRLGFLHFVVTYAIFLTGIFDMLMGSVDVLYYVVWLAPSFVSACLFVFGMFVMRVEQAHSDARYGVEVSRNDPWASFYDLEWEDDSPRTMSARDADGSEDDGKTRRKHRKRRKRNAGAKES